MGKVQVHHYRSMLLVVGHVPVVLKVWMIVAVVAEAVVLTSVLVVLIFVLMVVDVVVVPVAAAVA